MTRAQSTRQPLSRRGFSLVELLVVVAVVVILFSIFVPYVVRIRETDRRTRCANNLRAIHKALSVYAESNGLNYPRTPSDPSRPARYVAYTGAAAVPVMPAARPAPATVPTPATVPATQSDTRPATVPAPPVPGPDAVQFNDVTASLWLVVRAGYVEPQQFVCPSGDQTPDPMLTGGRRVGPGLRSNFTSGEHLSYSYCSPFSAAERFRLNTDVLPPDFVVMADKSPGVSGDGDDVAGPAYNAPPIDLSRANSRNHGRAGQNVLYSTGAVEFKPTPYCGYGVPPGSARSVYRDNVYTAYAAAPIPPAGNTLDAQGNAYPTNPQANGVYGRDVGPAWVYDSYLVPTDDE